MKDTALGYPTAAQVALRLQNVDLDELADDISFEHMPGAAVIMAATIVRRITHADWVEIAKPYPLLGTPKRRLTLAPPMIRAEYRRQFDAAAAADVWPGGGNPPRLYPHPDEIDRLAAEIETATARILG